MKIKNLILNFAIIAPLVFAGTAFAGYEHGNGGGVVVCKHALFGGIKSVELLDFYEARALRKLPIDLGDKKQAWEEKVKLMLERMKPVSDFRYQLYSKWYETFKDEALFIKKAQFTTIEDTAHIAIPKHCSFQQAAVQKVPQFPKDPRYYINGDLWEKMDDTQRAGLVLHELVYREAMSYGHTFSTSARYLVGKWADPNFAKIKLDEYLNLLTLAHFELVDIPFKADFTQTLSLDRLWRLSEFETTAGEMTLSHRLLLQTGRCAGDDCQEYKKDKTAIEMAECLVKSTDEDLHCSNYIGLTLAIESKSIQAGELGFDFHKCQKNLGLSSFNIGIDSKRVNGQQTTRITRLDAFNKYMKVWLGDNLCDGKIVLRTENRSSVLSAGNSVLEGGPVLRSVEYSDNGDCSSFKLRLIGGAILNKVREAQTGELSVELSVNDDDCALEVQIKNNRVTDVVATKEPKSALKAYCGFSYKGFFRADEVLPTDFHNSYIWLASSDANGDITNIDDSSEGTSHWQSFHSSYGTDRNTGGIECAKWTTCIRSQIQGIGKYDFLIEGKGNYAEFYFDEKFVEVLLGPSEFTFQNRILSGLKIAEDAKLKLKDGTWLDAKAGSTLTVDDDFNVLSVEQAQ